MNKPAHRRLCLLFDFVPQATSVIAVAVGAMVLVGWVFDVDTLKSVLPGLASMKVNTAVGFILAGVALWGIETGGKNRPLLIVAQVCATLVLLLGLLTIGEYVSGAGFGIDNLLIREITQLRGDIPGRMAVSSALSFAALGAALLLLSLGKGGLVVIHALAIVTLIAAGSALIGYGYNIEEFLREKLNYTPMALNAAAVFVLLAFGVINARADYPLRRFATSDNPAGVMVRRLLPAAIGFTLVTGWLIFRGYHAGYFAEIFGLALFAALSIVWLIGLILWNASAVYAAAVLRERMEESSRSAAIYARSLIEANLDPLVTISAEGKITDVNEATVKATGASRETLIGSDFSNYFTEPDKARAGYQEVFAKGLVTDYPLALRHLSGKVMDVLYNASIYRNAQGEVAGVFAAARDITESKRNEAINKARLHLVQFAMTHSLDELLEETINEAERLTGSLMGFYHFIEGDQNSLTLQIWSTRTKAEFCKAEGRGLHNPIADAGVWADCVRQGKAVIHNDYAALHNRKGLPDGHATVIRELVVPVRRGDRLSAILGVGNKPANYTERDVETVLLIANLTGEIAARKRAEEELQKTSELLNATQRLSKVGGWEFDVHTGRSIWTEELYRLHEMPTDAGMDHVQESLKCYRPEDRMIILNAFKTAVEKGEAYDLEFPFTTFKKQSIWIRTTGQPVYENDKIVRVIGNLMDITERKRAEARIKADMELLEEANAKLEVLSRQDALTGLANRRYLFLYLQDEWRRETRHGRPLSMIMIDIDYFKEYNDHYGHLAGDDCLHDVARALQSQVHRPGDILSRYGGEEFAVVLPETTLDGASRLAENLRSAVAQLKREHRCSRVAPHVTVSAGVAELSPKGHDINELISLADAALYRAKQNGRNQVAVAGLQRVQRN